MSDSQGESSGELTVRCAGGSEGVVDDVVTGAEDTSLVVSFPRGGAPPAVIGSVLDLELGGFALIDSIPLRGRVTFQGREAAGETVTFSLQNDPGHDLALPLRGRHGPRAVPEQEVPIELQLGEDACNGRLEDVSSGGASVSLEGSTGNALTKAWSCLVRFTLPGDSLPFELLAGVRYRKLVGDRVRLGLEFDGPVEGLEGGTESYGGQRDRLATWVLTRRARFLQQRLSDG